MSRPVAIVGPTAVGKSVLGIEIAGHVKGEIVSVDSLQVYRGFDIGTAKPTAGDRRRVPHHLIDILEPTHQLTAGAFGKLARQSIHAIESRGKRPILVGGSGLYLRTVLDGISQIPPTTDQIRSELRIRFENEGLSALRQWLETLDPKTARRIEPGDSQRNLRALGVVLSTQRGLADWHDDSAAKGESIPSLKIGLTLPRMVLYDRIAQRVHSMIQEGWLGEVDGLLSQGLSPTSPAFQAIGYRQLAAHLRGELSLDDATEEIIRATRRFAKRQITWFRRETDIHWLSMEDPRGTLREAIELLESKDLGGEND